MDDRVEHPATGVAVDSFILQGMATGQGWSRLVKTGQDRSKSPVCHVYQVYHGWPAPREAPSVLVGTVQFGSVQCSAMQRRPVFWLHKSWLLSFMSLSLLHASVLPCETRCMTSPLSGSSLRLPSRRAPGSDQNTLHGRGPCVRGRPGDLPGCQKA
jgi:hypothetical protein